MRNEAPGYQAERESTDIAAAIERDGFCIAPGCLSESACEYFGDQFADGTYGVRELLTLPAIQQLACSASVRRLVVSILGDSAFAVSGTFFNKTPAANWKVPWHQDRMIKVKERFDLPGWGPWSMKGGVLHVQPPSAVMSDILAVRLHLDDCPAENGALRVIPRSHSQGFLNPESSSHWQTTAEFLCAVPKGGALLMSPLILHTSSPSALPETRRVIHLEFASVDLPQPLEWCYRIA